MDCVNELDSFFLKFKTLLFNGVDATLNLQRLNGRICVNLNADLGLFQLNPHPNYQNVEILLTYAIRQE